MDFEGIKKIWNAYLEVQEGKHKKEGKLDPVGQEDGDVDNDGDVDSSDKYLKNRRKAIGKAMGKEKEEGYGKMKKEGSEESPYPSLDKKKREKPGSNLEPAKTPSDKLKGESVEESVEEVDEESCGKDRMKEQKVECPKCEGEGCDHCDGKGYHEKEEEGYGKKKMKESNLFSEEELASLEEKMKQPGDTGGKPEGMFDKESPKSKKFYADHEKGSDKSLEDMEAESEHDGSKAGRAVKSQAPKRRGENRAGDLAMPKVKTHPGQVGSDLSAGK